MTMLVGQCSNVVILFQAVCFILHITELSTLVVGIDDEVMYMNLNCTGSCE